VNFRTWTAAELLEQVAALARRLEVAPPGLGEIRRHAESLGETKAPAAVVAVRRLEVEEVQRASGVGQLLPPGTQAPAEGAGG